MELSVFQWLVAVLMLWALLSLGSALVGLYAKASEYWRAFWFMSGMWGLIDGLLAWSGFVKKAGPMDELARILLINAGLDLLYVSVGIILMTRRKPTVRGFGLAVLIQGLFLLGFDFFFWLRCSGRA